MKKIFTLAVFIISCTTINAQPFMTYYSLEMALESPNMVYKLNLQENDLKSLPESIGQLTNLKEMWLLGNSLTDLPESFGQLTKLTKLDLRNNKFTIIPESIGELKNLTKLYLTGNRLTKSDINRIKKILPNCEIVFE